MNAKCFLLFLLFFFTATCCTAQSMADSAKVEDSMMKIIFALPEVRKVIKQNAPTPVTGIVNRKPDGGFKYYWVAVGLDSKPDFTTFFHFFVDPHTLQVSYLDTLSDSVWTLPYWRTKSHSTKAEDKIAEILLALPEVKKLIKDNEHRIGHIAVITKRKPEPGFKYYWMGVGANNDLMFTTFLNFYVDPKTMVIKYLDTASDSLLTLQQWRAKEKHR